MSNASARANINSEHTLTPFGYQKNNLKPVARKLWQRGDTNIGKENGNLQKEQWDELESPQFVDFSKLPEIDDSFFSKSRVIVSTPNVTVQDTFNDNALIESLKSFSLSGIDFASPKLEQCDVDSRNENTENESEMNNTVIKMDKKKPEKCKQVKQQLNIPTNPFRRPLRYIQEIKPEHIKKNVEEAKKPWVFRANPVPKYLKLRATVTNENNKNTNNNVGKANCNTVAKDQKLSSCHKNKTNEEVWNKPPILPCPVRKNLMRPKTPPLQTAIRAEERKRFNNILKMKELEMQQRRQMELAANKIQEEREIALLRKQTVHKAQPVPKYKLNLPKVPKRPLTDAISPLTLKRRRIAGQ
nr:uncharacterized protein LOC117227120 [Megalopta genalis]XP_033338021.1 uncharacterized protein LOC117227120 [Megalopta genalis]XP_033338030.1 uncharacterized protein LOC117227120 [Megalopta genalis]XP_033338032.1 uncharacterized protein LOC117227120 [Megalopta genalis]XP_033338041.1 uncharacterized protein LOC117227120 [Megalopta genalis]